MKTSSPRGCCRKCCLGMFAYILALLVLLFLVLFVVFPVVFKYSVGIQRGIIFPTWHTPAENYSDFIEMYGLKGVRNMYVNVDEDQNITLGVYHILPAETLRDHLRNDQYDFEKVLANGSHSVLLYLHGNGGTRSVPLELYEILRSYFQIIACDYRGYADSSKAEMTEDGIVGDVVNLYRWVQNRTSAKIFVWGHSLGTAVATHAISDLKNHSLVPTGLVLETPFTSVPDAMELYFLLQYYKWLPWFSATFLEPMVSNGFGFESKRYILNVDCPIMILHAKDDSIIPYELATKLYDIAIHERNATSRGNVTYHLFEALGYDHMMIFEAPELPTYIREFVEVCNDFDKERSLNNNNNTIY